MFTEFVLITATTDLHEGHDVRICGIPGTFLSADMDEEVKMELRWRLVEIMLNIVPRIYIQHVIYEKVRPVLYVTLKKAIYRCLKLAFLIYERLLADMRVKEFELNPYGPCVVNKIIGGKQITVYWHVDELKVSHVDPKEVTYFMEWLEGIYGELSITRGDLQKYLGMTLDFQNP